MLIRILLYVMGVTYSKCCFHGVGNTSAITGHKDIRMLMRYTHLREEDLARKLG